MNQQSQRSDQIEKSSLTVSTLNVFLKYMETCFSLYCLSSILSTFSFQHSQMLYETWLWCRIVLTHLSRVEQTISKVYFNSLKWSKDHKGIQQHAHLKYFLKISQMCGRIKQSFSHLVYCGAINKYISAVYHHQVSVNHILQPAFTPQHIVFMLVGLNSSCSRVSVKKYFQACVSFMYLAIYF